MQKALKKGRAVLIELYTRTIKAVKDTDVNADVYYNGEDNNYPMEVERVVNSSPTASRASKMNGKYISGKGLKDESKDIIVNPRKNLKLSNIAFIAGQNMAKQGGVWIHRGFGIDEINGVLKIVPKTLDILDYTKCRKAKEDDEGFDGKIIYKDYCEVKSFGSSKKTDATWFYPFNNDQNVIISQIVNDHVLRGGQKEDELSVMLPNYRGQVYYLNTTPEYEYALAPIDPVFNDADTEARIQTYINGEVREGFLGKTAVLTVGLDDEVAKQVDKQIEDWLGDKGSKGVFRLDLEQAEDITKVLHVIQLKAQIDPKLFESTKKEVRSSILGAFNSIPELLVISGDGALFGTSGDTYKQAKIFYTEQTSDERWMLSETLTMMGFPCEIKPIIDVDTLTQTESETVSTESTPSTSEPITDETLKAQATLKGSVGGVQGILGIQQSVSQGLTDFESAITILTEIYGFTRSIASALLGKPEIQEDNVN